MGTLFRVETDRCAISVSSRNATPKLASGVKVGILEITPRRDGLTFGDQSFNAALADPVWNPSIERVGPALFEYSEYSVLLQGRGAHKVELHHRDPVLLQTFNNSNIGGSTFYGVLNFGGQIGTSLFSVWVDGRPEIDIELEVFPSKLDYRTDYASLVTQLQQFGTSLALEYLRPTSQFGAASVQEGNTTLEWLTLLGNAVDELEAAFKVINAHPFTGLQPSTRNVRADRLRRASSHTRNEIRRGSLSKSRFVIADDLSIPTHLSERHAEHTLDTPEHRWLAGKLRELRRRLSDLRNHPRSLFNQEHRAPAIRNEIEAIEIRIANLERLPICLGARSSIAPATSSLQLLTAPGYRDAYRIINSLSNVLRISQESLQLSVKDLHVLYEYWCFVRLVSLVAESLNQPFPNDVLAVHEEGLRVTLRLPGPREILIKHDARQSVRIKYKPRLSGEPYLTAQEPDFLISFEQDGWPTMTYVLDAKYRLDQSQSYIKRYGHAGPPEDALNVLHRYRDAILLLTETSTGHNVRAMRTVVEAAVLYPAHVTDDYLQSKLWRSLEKIGVGAIPFLPNGEDVVRQWFERALQRGGSSMAERVIPHVMHERAEEYRRLASETVLVGVLRPKNSAEHLQWVLDNKMYYAPALVDQRLQYSVQELAIYSPRALHKGGAITHAALVQRIERIKRSEIPTPWAGRDFETDVILYHLEDLRLIDPIPNTSADAQSRVSANRWTSRLGLLRARNLNELLMETVAEWQLYEDLKAERIEFVLSAGSPTIRYVNKSVGRAIFVVSQGKISFRGTEGFVLQGHDNVNRHFVDTDSVVEYLKELS
jgi:predicted component of viral defense system (DUF524 family)